MISIDIDEHEFKKLCKAELKEKMKEIDAELVFWDTKELKRRTCMSWNTIQDTFFHDERFPKYKVGGKWYFPAAQTKEFLLDWLERR
ncbi:group-specific protein [Peribacillus loiseleuriae]|uniref:group-specific protein n=1 Tax=Peribacillus loiseleuriae TaxID=1679170 RepID=UPI003D0269DD